MTLIPLKMPKKNNPRNFNTVLLKDHPKATFRENTRLSIWTFDSKPYGCSNGSRDNN